MRKLARTDGQTDRQTDRQADSNIPSQTMFAGGIIIIIWSLNTAQYPKKNEKKLQFYIIILLYLITKSIMIIVKSSLCCLFFFNIWILITPLVPSNSSAITDLCRLFNCPWCIYFIKLLLVISLIYNWQFRNLIHVRNKLRN